MLIGDIFRNAARAVPDRSAAVLGDTVLTYAQIDSCANRTARALARLGISRGDRVVVWSATSLDTVPVFAALAKLGAVFAPVNAGLSAAEAMDTVLPADPALIVCDLDRVERAAEVSATTGMPVAHIAGLAGGASADAGEDRGASGAVTASLAALAGKEDESDFVSPDVTEHDPQVVFFTSGSTGRPKGAILSHRVNFLRTHPGSQLEPRGAMVCPYPLFHMGAWTIALQQWQARDAVIFLESADAASICAAIERHRATRLNSIPAVWRRVLDHLASPEGRHRDMTSVRFADTGTSATPLDLLEAIRAAMPNAVVRVFYGSTEAGAVAMLEDADLARKPGSCGPPAPFQQVRLDERGELCTRGPLLFSGYFGNPEATADALADGWYHTGDLAELDSDGYITIVGRARDVIRTGGESVTPSEVESVLADHPAVADLAVIGIPDVQWGEVVCAVVVTRAGAPAPTVEQLRSHCTGRLASYKHPRRVEVVDAIPRTPATNQVQRRLLVERLA